MNPFDTIQQWIDNRAETWTRNLIGERKNRDWKMFASKEDKATFAKQKKEGGFKFPGGWPAGHMRGWQGPLEKKDALALQTLARNIRVIAASQIVLWGNRWSKSKQRKEYVRQVKGVGWGSKPAYGRGKKPQYLLGGLGGEMSQMTNWADVLGGWSKDTTLDYRERKIRSRRKGR